MPTTSNSLFNLTPWDEPPESIRVRAIKVTHQGQPVQLIAAEKSIIDLQILAAKSGNEFRVNPTDPKESISAIPGYYGFPCVVDQPLVGIAELALATDQRNHYVRVKGCDLVGEHADITVDSFAVPVANEPTPANRIDDTKIIESTVLKFTEKRIKSRVDETLAIPPLPEAARRVIALKQDPNYDLSDLVQIIETDPSLAARIMGWANSSFYSADPKARSISDAVMRVIGFDLVFNMSLGLAVGETLRLPKTQSRGLPPFWLDALFTAATMEALAKQMPAGLRPEVGLCYLAGLLNNFGTLVIGHVFPPQFERIISQQAANRHLPHTYIDQLVLGMPREIVASELLANWEMPQEVIDAVRFQHTAYEGQHGMYVDLLRLSHQVLSEESVNDYPVSAPDKKLMGNLEIDNSRIESVLQLIVRSRADLDGMAKTMGR